MRPERRAIAGISLGSRGTRLPRASSAQETARRRHRLPLSGLFYQGAPGLGPGMAQRISWALTMLLRQLSRAPSGESSHPMARQTSRAELSP
jgi:hypothetical protein